MNWSPQNLIQLILILLVLSFGAISWIFKKLHEQAAVKRDQVARQRRMEEALRTGHVESEPAPFPASSVSVSPTDARRRLQELAERRQRQLEELRRRQQGQRQGEPGAPAAPRPQPPPIIIIGPTGPVAIPRPAGSPSAPVAIPSVRPIPPRAPAPPPRPVRPAPQPTRRRPQRERPLPAAFPTVTRAQAEPEESERPVRRLSAPALQAALDLPGAQRPAGARLGAPLGALDWRRAMIVREILSPPVAMRERADGPVGW